VSQPKPQPVTDGALLPSLMPEAAKFYAGCAAAFTGMPHVEACIAGAIALRQAIDADDYPLVNALFREFGAQKIEPVHALEQHPIHGQVELGVSPDEIRAFAQRHRAARRASTESTR